MVVAYHIANEIAVYLGDGHGAFLNETMYSTGSRSNPYMVAVGDFISDSRLDVAVANFGTNSIGIFHGFGNGSFEDQKKLSTGSSRPIFISVADLNNDTLVDIATANYGTHSISIFYGDGKANFSDPVTYATGDDSLPLSLAAGDFNNDHYVDIAVANYGTGTVGILFANRNGTFENQIIISTNASSHPSSIAVGHINDDAFLDIVVANYATRNIRVLLGNAHGNFANQMTYAMENASPYCIGIGDLNQGNKMDLVVTSDGRNNIAVLLESTNGTFTSLTKYYSTGSSSSNMVAIGDLNKDHRLDILVVNNDTGAIDVLLGSFEVFAEQKPYPAGASPQSAAAGDFNNDSRLDIIGTNYGDGNMSVLLGNGDGSFANQTTYLTGSRPQSVAVGDFNHDYRLDIVVANSDDDNLTVLLGNGDGSFANHTPYANGSGLEFVAAGDFNNDSRLDIVCVNSKSNTVGVLLGMGDGSFTHQRTYPTGSSPKSATIADFNNDSRLDIMVSNCANNTMGVLLGNGDGSFADQTSYPIALSPQSIVVGDFNGDSRLDTFVATSRDSTPCVLLQHNRGALTKYTSYASGGGSSLRYVAVIDLNNDTQLDIIVANYGTDTVGALIGLGDGTFQSQTLLLSRPNSNPSSIAIGDYNGDLRKDIAVMNYGTRSVDMMLGDGKGTFTTQTDVGFRFAMAPFLASAADFNKDR